MADTTIGTSVAIATPDLEIIEGQITTTSNQVAAHFGKRHTHVLRAIRNLLAELPPEHQPNFGLTFTEVIGPKNAVRKDPAYRITRDGFTLLAMGFTGKEAMQWKVAYLTAFNKMEQELQAKRPAIPYSVHPNQTLSAEQAKTLRELLTTSVKRLPQAKQAGAMVQGWSKLKAHFGTDYRHIPASEFHEAVSIVARHAAQWELVEQTPPPAPRPALPPGKMVVDRQKLAAIWKDLGVLRARIDGLGILESDLPPSWWAQHQISAG